MDEPQTYHDANYPELRSTEVNELIGKSPPWILRWGNGVFVGVIVVLLFFSWFFKYPDTIDAAIVVSQDNPPADVVAKVDGDFDTIIVSDDQYVEKGALLAVIHNPAVMEDVEMLYKYISHVQTVLREGDIVNNVTLPDTIRSLGSIQEHYEAFITALNQYVSYASLNPDKRKVGFLKRQRNDYKQYIAKLEQQLTTLERDIQLGTNRLKRDSTLYSRGTLSQQDYENAIQQYNKLLYAYEGQQTLMANTQIEVTRIEQQIMEAEITVLQEEQRLFSQLFTAVEKLHNSINTWRQHYLLVAPVSGRVTFTTFWSSNQTVRQGDIVFTIVPDGKHRVIGKAFVNVNGAGKLDTGQQVLIRLSNFPALEYGILKGRLTTVSKVTVEIANELYYTADIALPEKLVTTYNKTIPVNQELHGYAEIVTADKRLIERIIEPLLALLKNRT